MKTMNGDLAVSIVIAAQQTHRPVYLKRGVIQVDAKSILGVMSLVDLEDVDVICDDHDVWDALMKILMEA